MIHLSVLIARQFASSGVWVWSHGPRDMDQTQILDTGRLLESVKQTLTLVSPPVPVSAVMTLSGIFINVQTLKIAHITLIQSHKNE